MTEAQRTRIVELRLDGLGLRKVATIVGCDESTVQRWWQAFLVETGEERRSVLEQHRTQAVIRMERLAERAAEAAEQCEEEADRARWVSIERRALVDLARIGGFEAPRRIHLDIPVQPSIAEAEAALAEWVALRE